MATLAIDNLLKRREQAQAALKKAQEASPEAKARAELAAIEAEIRAAQEAERAAKLEAARLEVSGIFKTLDDAALEIAKSLIALDAELDRLAGLAERAQALISQHRGEIRDAATPAKGAIFIAQKAVKALLYALDAHAPAISRKAAGLPPPLTPQEQEAAIAKARAKQKAEMLASLREKLKTAKGAERLELEEKIALWESRRV